MMSVLMPLVLMVRIVSIKRVATSASVHKDCGAILTRASAFWSQARLRVNVVLTLTVLQTLLARKALASAPVLDYSVEQTPFVRSRTITRGAGVVSDLLRDETENVFLVSTIVW